MSNLVLIRHGITQYNQEKRHCGFIDIPITPLGAEQAKKAATTVKENGISVDAFYVSWLQRAWETYEVIRNVLEAGDKPVTRHPMLNERHYGDLQGLLHADVIAKYGEEQFKLFRRSYSTRPPNGESLADVVGRVSYYLEAEIVPQIKQGKAIVIACHGNTIRATRKYLENIPHAEIAQYETLYDQPYIYDYDEANGKFTLRPQEPVASA